MKPLNLDQQIQIARILGWISGSIEGDSRKNQQHGFILRAAQLLCPILNLEHDLRSVDDLWELAGLPEGGLDAQGTAEWPRAIGPLCAPLRRTP